MRLVVFICMFIYNLSVAQSSVNSSGGAGVGSGGSTSFSVGEVAFSNFSSGSGSVMEGIQFPYEIVALSTSVFEDDIQLMVFPNPAIDIVTLKINNEISSNLDYKLFDALGKEVASKKNLKVENQIAIGQFLSSLYFLKVYNGGREVKVFKIIKN